ncbi:MAG: type I-E CRISPR-associated protein Cas6/Cse3/CasE [Rhodospirillaceae bacterium]|nr:type I-E CRISPR-associated protein Cas6/Cse3/CasE [Rhodospirillaceae bacterium]MYH38637.1 type I-E CRISPR-associated protein Cas6/Cse3/CasE [Rhodospirillaceae bacterium]MYK13929.1 type I-E CRISPR-associated protein Cas6/Cse3/CasE [Rhodospirillaceae bacterium]
MMLDHEIPKPPTLTAYRLHRMVEGLTDGESPLFADLGDTLLVRTAQPLTDKGRPLRPFETGDLLGFELRACVSKKRKGRHIYYPLRDWRSRHAWLARQGEKHGFEPRTVNCRAGRTTIDDGRGRRFAVDRTDFTGILRVTDAAAFRRALETGIGSTARAFGFGLLLI